VTHGNVDRVAAANGSGKGKDYLCRQPERYAFIAREIADRLSDCPSA
jgi:hypothetical protein